MKKISYAVLFAVYCLSPCVLAHETEEKIPDPGFRPESQYAATFLDSVGKNRIVVYPTIVRTKTTDDIVVTIHQSSQKMISRFLAENTITDPNDRVIQLGQIKGQGQFQWFQNDLDTMTKQIEPTYHLAIEVIVIQNENGNSNVFGIHTYILDDKGQNAFSFLLNSHHQILVNANLHADNNREETIDKLVNDSVHIALHALKQQIQQTKQVNE